MTARPIDGRTWTVVALGTMCSALPMFLTGALGVQLREENSLSATDIGLALGFAFTTAALLSAPMGRVAQHLGPRQAMRSGLAVTATVMIAVALVARDAWQFWILLGVAGCANALTQPSANLMLATHVHATRLGLALAVKQSGMPAAALLGGAAVPLVALTFGWQWAYVLGAGLAVLALSLLPPDVVALATTRTRNSGRARPDLETRLLVLYAVVGLLGASTAGAMVGFLTSGATESGLDPGVAGVLLSVSAFAGIVSRLFQGWQVDATGVLPIQRLVWLFALGGLSVLVLAVDVPATYLLAAIPAFAFGWAWPGLFNLSVVRNNPSAPASATGVSQVGVYIGAAIGPAAGGLMIDGVGYRALWTAGAAMLLAGAAVAVYLRARVRADRTERPSQPGTVRP